MSLQNAIHVKDGKVYGAGLPDEYPASNVTLSGGGNVEDRITPNTLGTPITLTINTNYTTTSDGYFKGKVDSYTKVGDKYVQLWVDGVTLVTVANVYGLYQEGCVFVRKGSVIKYVGSDQYIHAWFCPLI